MPAVQTPPNPGASVNTTHPCSSRPLTRDSGTGADQPIYLRSWRGTCANTSPSAQTQRHPITWPRGWWPSTLSKGGACCATPSSRSVTWENCSLTAKPFLLPWPTSWLWRHEPRRIVGKGGGRRSSARPGLAEPAVGAHAAQRKQPEFAAALQFVEREFRLNGRLDPGRSGAAVPSPDPAGR